MGPSDYQNSIIYLNDGFYPSIIALAKLIWCFLKSKKSKCPQKAKKVFHIYEHVHNPYIPPAPGPRQCWRYNEFEGVSYICKGKWCRCSLYWGIMMGYGYVLSTPL